MQGPLIDFDFGLQTGACKAFPEYILCFRITLSSFSVFANRNRASIPGIRRCGPCWKGYEAKRVSQPCASGKGCRRICTIGGAGNFSKPERNDWPEIRSGKPRRAKSPSCGGRTSSSGTNCSILFSFQGNHVLEKRPQANVNLKSISTYSD